jgi:hypothetical protein
VLSAHVVVDPLVLANGRSAAMLDTLQACLHGHFDVAHSTFQLEPASRAGHEPSVCDAGDGSGITPQHPPAQPIAPAPTDLN